MPRQGSGNRDVPIKILIYLSLNRDILPETAFVLRKTKERVLPSVLPSPSRKPQSHPTPPTRLQCLLPPPTRPQSFPTLPTGPWSPLLTLTHSACQPSALVSGHQFSHPPARPQSSAFLTPLLPVEPLYIFPEDEKVLLQEVVLEDVPEEDNDLFNQFTPPKENHSQDEGPSTSTVSDILY